MIRRIAAGLVLSLTLASSALADTPDKPLRLIGELAGKSARPFVLDAVVKAGDDEFRSTIDGWFAGLGEGAPSGEAQGSCVEHHCVISLDSDDGKLTITGDFGDATGPVAGHYLLKDSEGAHRIEGAATLRPLVGPVPGLGALAEGVDALELEDLLIWNGQDGGTDHEKGEAPSSYERMAVQAWQTAQSRPGAGLLLASDVELMRASAVAARKAAGWTAIGDPAAGWSAAYPATLLPTVSRQGRAQRFASADGKSTLVLTIDPPIGEDAFRDFAKKLEEDAPGRTDVNYARSNNDMDIHYEQGDTYVVAAYHSRDGAFVQLVLTYPKAAADAFSPVEGPIMRALQVKDDVNAK